jgi:hypothetical protein
MGRRIAMKRFLAAAASLCASVVACDGPQSHVYVAMLYEPEGSCLDPSTTLAIIGTPSGSLECAPACLVESAPPAVGAPRVYVSTMCPPYPTLVTSKPATDPACTGPLAAYGSGAVCGEDSGADASAANDAGGADDAATSFDAPPEGELGDSSEINDAKSD